MAELPPELSVNELHQLLQAGDKVRLVDCREPFEHEIVSLPGATLIPLANLPSRVGELGGADERLVVYCHHGMRSAQAVGWLRENGLPNAQSLAGGVDAWSVEIDPTAPRY